MVRMYLKPYVPCISECLSFLNFDEQLRVGV